MFLNIWIYKIYENLCFNFVLNIFEVPLCQAWFKFIEFDLFNFFNHFRCSDGLWLINNYNFSFIPFCLLNVFFDFPHFFPISLYVSFLKCIHLFRIISVKFFIFNFWFLIISTSMIQSIFYFFLGQLIILCELFFEFNLIFLIFRYMFVKLWMCSLF
jgi:hypothetical protein